MLGIGISLFAILIGGFSKLEKQFSTQKLEPENEGTDNIAIPKQEEASPEINSLEKESIEKEIQHLESHDADTSKDQLSIAKAKLESLSSSFYDKI